MPKWLNQFVKDDRTERVHSYCMIRKSHQNNWDCQCVNTVKVCRRNRSRNLPFELWSISAVENCGRQKCGWGLPPEMWPWFAAGNAAVIRRRSAALICRRNAAENDLHKQERENVTTIKDRAASPEKERVIPHQEVKNHMLTWLNINYVFPSPGTKS